jgi:hypothetical protein
MTEQTSLAEFSMEGYGLKKDCFTDDDDDAIF